MALSAQINLLLMAHETSSGDLSRTLRATPASYSLAIADGTGDNQAQVVWSASRTATTSNDDLMLSALADTRDGAAQPASPNSKSAPTTDPRRCPAILPMRPAPPFRV